MSLLHLIGFSWRSFFLLTQAGAMPLLQRTPWPDPRARGHGGRDPDERALTLPAWCRAGCPGSRCRSLHHSPGASAPGRRQAGRMVSAEKKQLEPNKLDSPWGLWGVLGVGRATFAQSPSFPSQRSQVTHLRSHKVGSVARGHEEPILRPQLLGKSKVTDAQALRVARLIHI